MPQDSRPFEYKLSWTLGTGEAYSLSTYATTGGNDHTAQAMEMLRDGLNGL